MNCRENFPADLCLKCSICNAVCPVYAVENSFLGPKFVGPELARLSKSKSVQSTTVEYCSGCRQCELACPAGVKITSLAQDAKVLSVKAKGIPLRDRILGHNQWVSGMASRVAPLTNLALRSNVLRCIAEKVAGIKNRPFPVYHFPFRYRPMEIKEPKGKVAYFIGCYGRYIGTAVALSVVRVFETCGIKVVVPPQKCCGVPLLANGLVEEARKNAFYNIKVLSELIARGYEVVTSCPSCALSLRDEYMHHLNLPEASNVANKVYDAAEYLLKVDSETGLGVEFESGGKRYFYHQPCHAKALGIGLPAVELLGLLPGLKLEIREQKCCGQAGTYGFKKEKYPISQAIGRSLFMEVKESDVDGIITECGMCAMQLDHGTGKKTYHPLEIFNSALMVPHKK